MNQMKRQGGVYVTVPAVQNVALALMLKLWCNPERVLWRMCVLKVSPEGSL